MNRIAPPPLLKTARDIADFLRPVSWQPPVPEADDPKGDGHGVLVVPGLGCPDAIMSPVRRFLRTLGYDAQKWEAGINVGPTPRAMRILESRLFAMNDRGGYRVSLVGKSLGGLLARELAKLHPERVRRLILICAPVQHPVGHRAAPLLYGCKAFYSPAISRDLAALSRPAPVPTTAFFTKLDGMLSWQSCLEVPGPLAENIELPGAYHTTAAMHPLALRIMAARLKLPDRV